MLGFRFRAGLLSSAVAVGWLAPATLAADVRPFTRKPTTQPASPTLVDVVSPAFKDAVTQVVKAPTLSAKATEEGFTAHPKVYDWLVEHPDRTAVAWKRRQFPCIEIANLGNGKFGWTDEGGSELTWEPVGKFQDGVVWYATGKVKAAALMPMVPVKAVAVLSAPRVVDDTEAATIKPSLHVYILTDSRAANAILRMAGPAAPRAAEQGAEQLLMFFSGVARHLHQHPDEIEKLLGPAKK